MINQKRRKNSWRVQKPKKMELRLTPTLMLMANTIVHGSI